MKDLFEKRMLWICLVLLMISFFQTGYIGHGTWDLNRSIGWGWDITNFFWWGQSMFGLLLVINILGYFLIKLCKRRTNYLFSVSHTLLLLLSHYIYNYGIEWYLLLLTLSILVFILNIIFSSKELIKQV